MNPFKKYDPDHPGYPYVFEKEEKTRKENFQYFETILDNPRSSFDMRIGYGENNHIYWVNSLREFINLIPAKREEVYPSPNGEVSGIDFWDDSVNVRLNNQNFSLREIMLFGEKLPKEKNYPFGPLRVFQND
jgi:hypothetical protein